jgi:hypothetical protein
LPSQIPTLDTSTTKKEGLLKYVYPDANVSTNDDRYNVLTMKSRQTRRVLAIVEVERAYERRQRFIQAPMGFENISVAEVAA